MEKICKQRQSVENTKKKSKQIEIFPSSTRKEFNAIIIDTFHLQVKRNKKL